MRQYISQKNLDKNGLLEIYGKDFRYMRQVLRLKAGDMVSVRLPDGNLRNMTLCRADDSEKKIVLQVCAAENEAEKNGKTCDSLNLNNSLGNRQVQNEDDDGQVEYYLFMFVPKSSKFDLIVRQATECGVSKIIPVSSDFSQKGAEKMNFRGERFERIIKEARQQSGSAVATSVENAVSVNEMCEIWKSEIQKSISGDYGVFGFVLYERSEFTTDFDSAFEKAKTASKSKRLKKCAVVCGSEGGISPDEIKKLLDCGFYAVHFKTNILRCETAALYGTAVLQNAASKAWRER